MLSYQHGFHAGNLADVHKHSLLAWALNYMVQKDKPLSYIETHAGRGLYDLQDTQAQKTGEAATGIDIAADWFSGDHPYRAVLTRVRDANGPSAYPGSPVVAAEILRPMDNIHLSELHPKEYAALQDNMRPYGGVIRQRDGWEMAMSTCPPDPRRGLMLIDPSFEVKADYETIPKTIAKLHRKWPVGVIMLWYPILTDGPHRQMTSALRALLADGFKHEVTFPPARPGHRMIGSGLFVLNPPYGLTEEAASVARLFQDRIKTPM
ncbi:23S rRNA (adenine(2030)-N(6))-methyltransferase RlmJ [Yoonia sp. SS1-5]|uniref:Ribosomal RNA large subunit methyltransferase J n=1 Tax=Yoonia rhodophyticola TaxID=3137370 RepID=A0AAN0ME71_9RHOB